MKNFYRIFSWSCRTNNDKCSSESQPLFGRVEIRDPFNVETELQKKDFLKFQPLNFYIFYFGAPVAKLNDAQIQLG